MKIRAVTIESNEKVVSFGVVSLFTSIPQALAVETLSDLLRQNYYGDDGQSTAQDLIEFMWHCLKTFFPFEEITYEQIKGILLDEIKLLQELSRANGNPRAFIERGRKQRKKRNEEHTQSNSWRNIPDIEGVSEAVAKSLAPLGIGVANRPDAKIRRQVMRPKDPIPKQEISAVVYRLQCSCGRCNYVGETDRRLQTRMHEHKLAVRRLDPKSEVATNAAQMGHFFNFDAVGIVGRAMIIPQGKC